MTGLWWTIGAVILTAVMVGAVKTGHPVRSLGGSAVQGLGALAAVNILSAFSGVTVGLTSFSAAVCVVLGIPGVIALLILQAILILPL